MKIALLVFIVWLIGFLITAYLLFRSLRYNYNSNISDYAFCFIGAFLSWIILIPIVVGYVIDKLKEWWDNVEDWWDNIDKWWHL